MDEQADVRNLGTWGRKKTLSLFGFGQFSRSLIWCVTDLLIAFHLNVRVGIAGETVGVILFLSFALGAALDLAVAGVVARLGEPLRVALQLQAFAGCATVVTAIFLFAPPPGVGGLATLAYFAIASILFRTAYTIFDVTQNALTSLLPADLEQLRSYVTIRTVVSSLGRLCASCLVFYALRNSSSSSADLEVVVLIGIPVGLSVISLARVRVPPLATPRVGAGVGVRWRSLPYRKLAPLVAATIFEVGLLGVTGRLLPFFGVHQSASAQGSALVVAMVCGTVAGPVLVARFSRPDESGRVALLLASIGAGAAVGLLAEGSYFANLVLATLYGASATGIASIIWQRVGQLVREEAALSGTRIDLVAFAVLTASTKLALALSSALLGTVLAGFEAGAPRSLLLIAVLSVAGGIGTASALALQRFWPVGAVFAEQETGYRQRPVLTVETSTKHSQG